MSITSHRYKLTALSAAIMAVNGVAYAQEGDAGLEEELIVTGIKGAMMRSIDDKREAKNIVDTINAEDMGKTTDQNIADSLGRVTGVTVVSRNGEGSQITVRGASATQNQITLNGQTLTSTDFNQSVDLSSYSSDILSKLEVVKTPSADHDEGSLGASVNLVTTRPLDIAEDVLTATIQGNYSDFSEELDHKLQFSVSKKFLDDTLGVTATIVDETNTYRKDQLRISDWRATADTIDIARDENGNAVSQFLALEPQDTNYELSKNTSDRQSFNAGIQWAPSDKTELMFNTTYAEQTQTNDLYGVRSRTPDANPNAVQGMYFAGSNQAGYGDRPAPMAFNDPQADWYEVDTGNRTLVSKLARGGKGDLTRSTGGTKNENFSATLDLSQELTDRFRLDAKVGYSSSKSESLPSLYTNMQNFLQVGDLLLSEVGPDIEQTGYVKDGDKYVIVAGQGMIDYGEQDSGQYEDETGALRPDWWDNTITTGFNPADTNSFHLGSIVETQRTVEDTLGQAQVDFDFDLDFAGMTTTEFGVKYTTREKSVDDQRFTYSSSSAADPIVDEDGNVIGMPGGPLSGIRGNLIADENGLPYDNFMETLGYDRSNVTNGWTPIDVWKAWDLVVSDPDSQRTPNNLETRSSQIDTGALYLKQNFAFFDDRLTGDIGVRYVRTEIESTGYAGMTIYDFPDNSNESEFDLMQLRQLRDTSLPACPQPNWNDDDAQDTVNLRQGFENKFNRVDGIGWDTSVGTSYDEGTDTWTIDPSQWTRIPDAGPCHDPQYAEYARLRLDGIDDADQTLPTINWATMWRYADVDYSRDNGWDYTDAPNPTNITWNGTGTQFGDFTVANRQDFTSAYSQELTDTHSYSNILPSLNLNFAITDDLIVRGAISQTMTRPEIEDTRAGYLINSQAYWATGNAQDGTVANVYNTQLEPLESNNLDLGVEWYFNDSSMISAALFHKDMSNFTDTATTITKINDPRKFEDGLTGGELPLAVNLEDTENEDYGLDNCMALRAVTDFAFGFGDDTLSHLQDDARNSCADARYSQVINGKSAKITGLELGYSQAYDFLPGYFLSGLGVNANYTYQDSEYEPDVVNGIESPGLPVAETPEHTYNLTAFWEQDGHQVRLSYRGATDSLVDRDWNEQNLRGRTWKGGSLWNEGRDTLDLSATYNVNEYMDVTFQAINLTDAAYRQYFTSRTVPVGAPVLDADGQPTGSYQEFNEGNPLEDSSVSKDRTVYEYKVGTTFRLGVRVNF
ncbi:TonB-dependent receptor domain-containing protein [Agaribacterium sp. ZY112]|uniref:TonB-dependent receptor domain-containing protein n=1 Tax=Agaribacterium sp. ZY112 TaxID=3233574 RepID=UPI003526143B